MRQTVDPVEHFQPSNHGLCENDCPRECTYSQGQHSVSDSGAVGGGEEGEKGSGDRSLGGDQLSLGFVNCRGWWSREVDIKLRLQELKLDVLDLAETFLREEDEASVAGYVWYGRNREGCKRASGGVGILVRKELQSRLLSCQREGVVWMELKLREGKKVAVGVMYANPEGVHED